ncbi:MAG: PIN domain-containing protein [Ignavibacteria bacterium]|nr:PIN domain-containing protein [Ignavibacteria bacterium]
MHAKSFFDTNLWIYLFLKSEDKGDQKKHTVVKNLLTRQPHIVISTQVLNEFSNVMLSKYRVASGVVSSYIESIISMAEIRLLTEHETIKALRLKSKFSISFYDALIVASALEANTDTLYSEDMQTGLSIENKLTIVNPFLTEIHSL